VTAALQAYADRGIFRGFRATTGRAGRTEYEFGWLLRPPMRAVFDPPARALAFPALFPGVDPRSAIGAALETVVQRRSSRDTPAHKRIDRRRAEVAATLRRGNWSLTVRIHGQNAEYAVQRTLSLINDLFLTLHEQYPDYLIERFGLSPE
jgi:hypothetical protein